MRRLLLLVLSILIISIIFWNTPQSKARRLYETEINKNADRVLDEVEQQRFELAIKGDINNYIFLEMIGIKDKERKSKLRKVWKWIDNKPVYIGK